MFFLFSSAMEILGEPKKSDSRLLERAQLRVLTEDEQESADNYLVIYSSTIIGARGALSR